MPTPTLVATSGSPIANSYTTLVEADAYHDARLASTDWTSGVSPATKTVALITATRLLDAMYVWSSYATYPLTQKLQWPRVGMLKRNGQDYVGNDEIPPELKDAVAEFARQLIVSDRSLDSDIEAQGITSIRAGSVALTFKDLVVPKVVPDAVINLLVPSWGFVKTQSASVRFLVRA